MLNQVRQVRRGELYLCGFGRPFGTEPGEEKYAIVVQNDISNKFSPTTLVVPCTTSPAEPCPTHTFITFGIDSNTSLEVYTVRAEKLRVVDKRRLSECIDQLSPDSMEKVDQVLKTALCLGHTEEVRRGQLYLCDFGDPFGAEQGFLRYAIVVQNSIGDPHSQTTVVVPCTTRAKKDLPTHFTTTFCDQNVVDYNERRISDKPNTILAEQARVVNKKRLVKYLGKLSPALLSQIDRVLKIALGL